MLQFRHSGGAPTLAEAKAAFGLEDGDVDADYGIVATDPREGLYVVRVDPAAAAKVRASLAGRPGDEAEGLFGDVRIEPTG